MSNPFRILLLAGLLLAPLPALAADIHVSVDGSDAASGSPSDPLRSVSAALALAADGDTVYLHDGIYSGNLVITQSNFTLRSAPGEYAVIRSSHHDPDIPAVISIATTTSNVTLDRLDIRGGYDHTVHLLGNAAAAASGVQLTNLNLRDGGIELLRADAATDFTLAHSTLSGAGQRNPDLGVLVASRARTAVMRHNVFYGAFYSGVEITGGGDSVVIDSNYFGGTLLAALTLDPALAVAGDFTANGAPEPYAVAQASIVNNVFQYLEAAALTLRGTQQADIFNNSILQYHGIAPVGRFQSRDVGGTVVDNDLVTLANNLLTFASDSSHTAWSVDSGGVAAHDFNDNAYYGSDGNPRFEYQGSSGGLPTWQALTGQADRSFIAEPQLRFQARLEASSPLRDAGRVAGAPAADYDAEPRSDGQPDIGADEYSALNSPALPPISRFAGTGVTDGSGEGLFEIRGIRYDSGGGSSGPTVLALLLFTLICRRLRNSG